MRRQVTFPLKDNSWKGKYRNGAIFAIFTILGTYIYMKNKDSASLMDRFYRSNQRPFLVQFGRKTEQYPTHCLEFRLDFILFLFYSNETVISDAVCLQNRPHGPDFRPVYICIMTCAL